MRWKRCGSAAPLLALFIAIFSCPGAIWATDAVLWEIGWADRDTRDMALAPDGYAKVEDPVVFTVGRSSAVRDWPYAHPGPADAWGGSSSHTFTVFFGLAEPPSGETFTLALDLVDTHPGSPPRLDFALNGTYRFALQLPKGGSDDSISGKPSAGKPCRFTMSIPADAFRAGVNVLTIENAQGSWMVYDRLAMLSPKRFALADVPETAIWKAETRQVLTRSKAGLVQPLLLTVLNTVKSPGLALFIDGQKADAAPLLPGEQTVEIPLPEVKEERDVRVEVRDGGRVLAERIVRVAPVRPWTVYFLPHSHVDIGYTELQTAVGRTQWENLEKAVELARSTANYPEGARFKWNAEVLWAVDSYLRTASPEKKAEFVEAVRKGWVGLDALYGSMLTGLARPEELFRFTECARRLSKEYGFTIESAMITDVPGYSWGMVPALAQSGVRYFNPGPNFMPMLPHLGDRIGYTIETWGDKPFWWVSPSGKEEVLVWIPSRGYSWFHEWLAGRLGDNGGKPILDYLGELASGGYPYDMAQLRYTVGADNGPPDPDMPEFVREWNAEHVWPKLVIATTGEMFREFERRYGKTLPRLKGDFTPYWEDGAGSTPRETALNRTAAERLTQAQTLWTLRNPETCPAERFSTAWRDVILYTEHTWGAHSSISAPESEFALGQWAIKQKFALDADRESGRLLAEAAGASAEGAVQAVEVFNTNSWARRDLVVLPASWRLPGDRVTEAAGTPVPSQRLASGELAFLADNVPALGSKRYTVTAGEAFSRGSVRAGGARMEHSLLSVVVDEATGAVSSLVPRDTGRNLADIKNGPGLNDYAYLPEIDPKGAQRNGKPVITITDSGPLVATLTVVSEAPGATKLTREIRLTEGLDYVSLTTTIDRDKVYAKNSIHLAFPFDVPEGTVRVEGAWCVIRPDEDQLAGGNRNVFPVQRWADVSNSREGVTWATLDAPLLEIGGMHAEEWHLDPARPWLRETPKSTTLYSYVMNNYWHTNYRATQEGKTTFRYALRPHAAFDAAGAARFGMERSQPLVAAPTPPDRPEFVAPFELKSGSTIISSIEPAENGRAMLVRLYNPGERPDTANLVFRGSEKRNVWLSGPLQDRKSIVTGALKLQPFEVVALLIER